MHSLCPECGWRFDVTAAQLAAQSGELTCPDCSLSYPAWEHLHQDPPPVETEAAEDDMPEKADTPEPLPEATVKDSSGLPAETSRDSGRVWMMLAAALVIVTLVNLAWTLRQPLLEIEAVRNIAEAQGWIEAGPEPTLARDTDNIFLISRDMHPHPGLEDALVLSATFINRAGFTQPYPDLQITLYDLEQKALAQRRFVPADYLDPDTDSTAGMPPNVMLPVVLELVDPGPHAVGFEISFL